MSTAGKVLVVLILLVTVGWLFLGSGVAQLNRNGNAALAKLQADLAKAEEGLQQAQVDLVRIKDQTSQFQENMDTQVAVIRARVTDVEAAGSRLKAVLNNMQHQLETVQNTVEQAQHDLDVRKQERADETKALADARAEVRRLRDRDGELTDRLASLRREFKATYEKNVESLGTSSR
jgi:chromosome segregation ATPase